MSTVYVTRTGERFHADANCRSFDDIEDRTGARPSAWAADLSDHPELTRCSVCWPQKPGFGAWDRLAQDVEQRGDSPYEAVFVSNVLSQIKGLKPGDVTIQQPVTGATGRAYRVDFILSPANGHRTIIEIDGDDKAPGRKSPEQIKAESEQKRRDLMEAGWPVVNLRNRQVANNVEQCLTEIEFQTFPSVRPRPLNAPDSPRAAAPQTQQKVQSAHDGPDRGETRSPTPSRRWKGWALAGTAALVGIVVAVNVASPEESAIAPTASGDCPSDAPIKGNISESGARIFHAPGWRWYGRTEAEQCFSSAAEAEAAGFRESESK